LEIHRQVLPSSLSNILPSELVWNQIEPISTADAAFFVPAPTVRILHNLLHAALANRNYMLGRTPLRALHELAVMQTLYEKQTDWTKIRDLMIRGGKVKVLDAWLYSAHRLFGCALPGKMRPTFSAVTHYHRTRLQAQWRWTNELATRTHWFSARSICDRYECDSDLLSLTKGRCRLAASLAKKCVFLALRKTPPTLEASQSSPAHNLHQLD
jgi:hypothetical protein